MGRLIDSFVAYSVLIEALVIFKKNFDKLVHFQIELSAIETPETDVYYANVR